MQKIAVLGCGWLGLPLAKKLVAGNFEVSGSTTSPEKIELMRQSGIKPFIIIVSENKVFGDLSDFLKNIEILIIDIPPKLRGENPENFVKKIQTLIPFIEESSVEKVLFVSSTSVFADDNSVINHDSKPNPDSESGRQLLEIENLLQNNSNFETTIVRFGGLVGSDRHPGKSLAGKLNLKNPQAPVNLIHQVDCIGIIQKIINSKSWQQTFNAVAPFHPSRETYYTSKAKEFGLQTPVFDNSEMSIGKTVSNDNLKQVLGYKFLVVENI